MGYTANLLLIYVREGKGGSVDFKNLIVLSKIHEHTPESIEAFKERHRLREREFAKQSKLQTPTSEWYERSYDI